MPRKNVIRQVPPRPSFAQIAAHLAVNSDSDNLDVIDTRTQSNEFLTLQNLSGHLHSEIDRAQPGSPLQAILIRLSSACDNLLESCRRAKDTSFEDDPAAFQAAMRDAERNAWEFDRELKNFAQNDDIDLAMVFGESDIRKQAYGMWIEEGKYIVNQEDQKYLDALSNPQPNLNQDQQPNLNQQQDNIANEPPRQEGQPNPGGNQQPVQEENPKPAANQIPPAGQNADAGQRAQNAGSSRKGRYYCYHLYELYAYPGRAASGHTCK